MVEGKVMPPGLCDVEDWVRRAVGQVTAYIRALGISRGAVVIFADRSVPEAYHTARLLEEGTISVAVIQAKR